MNVKTRANNEVRIISGQWKGRKLKFPAGPDLRPTLGRVRETLFNWLHPLLAERRCLDLFAGSGALGFEALSRGAAEVTFVERDRKAADALRRNATLLGADVRILEEPARKFLARHPDRFDLIFFDPPFNDKAAAALLEGLLRDHLSAEGLLYLELPRRSEMPFPERRYKHGRAGDCQFALLKADPFAIS